MIRQLKIGKKLLVLVTSLLVFSVVIGGLSLFLMNKLNNASTEISEGWLPSVIIAEEINTMSSDYRIYELRHIMATDDKTREEFETKLTNKEKEIDNMFTSFQSLSKTDATTAIYEDTKTAWSNYLAISKNIIQLSNAGQTEAATKLIEGESRVAFDDVSAKFLQQANLNRDGAKEASEKSQQRYNGSIILLICLLTILIVIAIVFATLLVKMIVNPMKEIIAASDEIGKGNLDIQITYESADEVGQIAHAFSSMSTDLKMIIEDIQYLLGEMANGNFIVSTRCPEKYLGSYKQILTAIQGININLSNTLSRIDSAADQVALGSEQVSNGAQALSQGATEQASSIEELSATISDISTQVKENADNARSANSSAESAGRELENSSQQVLEMVNAMEDINVKSSEISKIIKVIEDIAFQTNILALNAAVEAARAGAAGKGFAVVADEVRNLASKSAEAAKSTTELIAESVIAVKNGSKMANHAASSMAESQKVTQQAILLIEKIAQASDRQAQAISQINLGVEQIATVVQTNSATAEESAAASEELFGQAQMLKDSLRKFQLKKNQQSTVDPFNNTYHNDTDTDTTTASTDKY